MKRDTDLIRDILLKIEDDPRFDSHSKYVFYDPADLGLTDCSAEDFAYHLTLLIEAEMIVGSADMRMPMIGRLTWHGHEFLDAVRDPGIWSKTKSGAKTAGNVGLQFLGQLAKAYAKQMAKEKLGVDLG